jgi:hypothetical protein
MSSPRLSFEIWKQCFHDDCVQQGKLAAFNALGDFVIEMFWKCGLEPSVQAIIDNGAKSSLPEKIFHTSEFLNRSA